MTVRECEPVNAVCFAKSKSEMSHHIKEYNECRGLFIKRCNSNEPREQVGSRHALLTEKSQTCRERVINSSNNGVFVVYREIINTRGVKSTFSQLAGGSLAKNRFYTTRVDYFAINHSTPLFKLYISRFSSDVT